MGRVCIDSGTIDEVVEDIVIRDRRHLSEDGFVLPIIAISKNSGRNETLPEISKLAGPQNLHVVAASGGKSLLTNEPL